MYAKCWICLFDPTQMRKLCTKRTNTDFLYLYSIYFLQQLRLFSCDYLYFYDRLFVCIIGRIDLIVILKSLYILICINYVLKIKCFDYTLINISNSTSSTLRALFICKNLFFQLPWFIKLCFFLLLISLSLFCLIHYII